MRRAAVAFAAALAVASALAATNGVGRAEVVGAVFGFGRGARTLGGVALPDELTEEQAAERDAMVRAFLDRLAAFDEKCREAWEAGLTDEQRAALRAQSAEAERKKGLRDAEAARRKAEREAITNRMAFVTKEYVTRRKKEYLFAEGLTWQGLPLVREVVLGEGRMCVRKLYVREADGRERGILYAEGKEINR